MGEQELVLALRPIIAETHGPRAEVEGIEPFGNGHSGFTYRVAVRGDGAVHHRVLRVSPPGARIVGPSDVGLQGRIMQAVGPYGVPVPRVLAQSSEPVLNGRAYALMEQVTGTSWDEQRDLDDQEVMAAAVAVLERLRKVPVAASGLDLSQARDTRGEVEHWARLLSRCDEDIAQPLQAAVETLRASAPATEVMSVVHGDFHFGNLLFHRGAVAAVLDWEIASIGDPLFDVAGLVVAAMRARYAPEPNPTGSVRTGLRDIATAAGVREPILEWYVAASCFKYAAILGYNHRLHRSGKRIDPVYDQLGETMRGLADAATIRASTI